MSFSSTSLPFANGDGALQSAYNELNKLTKLHSAWTQQVRVHGIRVIPPGRAQRPHFCLPGKCRFATVTGYPEMFVCLSSGNVHICPGVIKNPEKMGYTEGSVTGTKCGFTRRLPGEMASVCALTGTYQMNTECDYEDDPIDVMVLRTRAEKYTDKVMESRKLAKEKAVETVLSLIHGETRRIVEQKSIIRQTQMRRSLERRWKKVQTASKANGGRVTRDVAISHAKCMKEQADKERRTEMQKPIENPDTALCIARAVVNEAMIVLDAMKCPDKDIVLGCVAYLYNMRRGVNGKDGLSIIPSHERVPAPGFYRATDIEISGLSRLRQLTTTTGDQVSFIMNNADVTKKLRHIYSGNSSTSPAMPERIKAK